MDKKDIIFCDRCGAEMNKDARYCLKCGKLNYDNPSNASMVKYASEENNNSNNNFIKNNSIYQKATKAGNIKIMYITNAFLFIGLLLLLYILFFVIYKHTSFNNLFFWSTSLGAVSIITLLNLSYQIMTIKANKPWYGSLIPFYNLFQFSEIATGKGYIAFFPFIFMVFWKITNSLSETFSMIFGIASLIVYIYILVNYAKAYNKNPTIFLLFSFILMPVWAYREDTAYKGTIYIPDNLTEENPLQKVHIINKYIYMILLGFIGLNVLFNLYLYRDNIKLVVNKQFTRGFRKDTEIIIDSARKSFLDDEYECSDGNSLKKLYTVHYVLIDEATDDFDSSVNSSNYGTYKGYIKIQNGRMGTNYYISINDGEYGIKEINIDSLKYNLVEENMILSVPDKAVICKKIKS